MAFDPNSLLDVSHFVTFLAGTGVGAAGTYLADRFTDQRRKGEAKREADAEFSRAAKLMPELFSEFREDLRAEGLLREFVVLRSERQQFMHGKPRIEIYETKHPQAQNQVGILVNAGYVSVVRATDTPIYQLEEHFVERLLRDV